MISAFQSRDFGFGLQISADQLSVIHQHRCQQNYIDPVAATAILVALRKSHCCIRVGDYVKKKLFPT